MDIIQFIIESLKNPITIGCGAAMVLTVMWFLKIRHQQVNAIASIVTVIGVFGTFVGIAWGLLNFDTNNVEASVPKLLEGLKAAFITSIFGIAGSIALKWSTLNNQKRQSTSRETYSGATVDDLADLLRNILEVEQKEGKETRESLRSIEKSLTGEGDSTVLTQLQKLRTTFSDKQDDLVRAFNEFAEKMAENNTNALIEALEDVMRDFNAKINEQFGDNFRQLNEAVGRINDWQEQYRQQMDELATQFRVAAESVEQSRRSLEIIANRSDAIVSSAEQLDPILQALQHQIEQLDTHLEAFSALAENARGAFPIIETRLNQLTDDFSTVVKETIDNSHTSLQNQREALANQSQQLETTVENTSNHIHQLTETVFQRTTERVEQVIADAFEDYRSALEDQSQQLQSTIITTNQALEDTLQNQSTRLQTMVESTSGQLRTMADEFSTVVNETIDNSHASMHSQREALANQSQQLETTVENTGNHIQQLTETVFQRTTERVEQVIDDTFQGFRSALENQSQQLQSTIISMNQGLEDTLQNQSTRLQTMIENTSGQLQRMADEFSTVVRETIDNSHASMQDQRSTINDFSVQVRESIDNSHADMVRQREALQSFTGQIETVIQNTSQGLENTLQTQYRQLNTETERIFRESTNLMTQQIQVLDESLGAELTRALESLGSQLTSLSSRFVADYTPLTEQLRNVVQMANNLEPPNSLRR